MNEITREGDKRIISASRLEIMIDQLNAAELMLKKAMSMIDAEIKFPELAAKVELADRVKNDGCYANITITPEGSEYLHQELLKAGLITPETNWTI